MQNKFLTPTARITDAYMQMYRQSARVNESTNGNGNLLRSLKGSLPIEGKGSPRTGSKLGVRKVLPFEKRDARNTCGHSVPMKKTFGNGKVKTVNVARGESIRHDIPSKTGSKLGVRKVLPFEKRDDRPTSIGRIKGVRDVSKVSKVRGVHESDEELELIDVETCEGCSEKDELLDLVLTTFEQIYDNLSDDDKETVDEVKAEIESVLNPEDEDDEDEEIDGDFDDDEDIGESVVNEAGPKKVAPRRKAAPKKTATKVEIPKPTRSASATRRSSAELRKEIEARRAVERGTEPAKTAETPVEPPKTVEEKPTEAPKPTEERPSAEKPTETPKAGEEKLSETPKTAEEKPAETSKTVDEKPTDGGEAKTASEIKVSDAEKSKFKERVEALKAEGYGGATARTKAAKELFPGWVKKHGIEAVLIALGVGATYYGAKSIWSDKKNPDPSAPAAAKVGQQEGAEGAKPGNPSGREVGKGNDGNGNDVDALLARKDLAALYNALADEGERRGNKAHGVSGGDGRGFIDQLADAPGKLLGGVGSAVTNTLGGVVGLPGKLIGDTGEGIGRGTRGVRSGFYGVDDETAREEYRTNVISNNKSKQDWRLEKEKREYERQLEREKREEEQRRQQAASQQPQAQTAQSTQATADTSSTQQSTTTNGDEGQTK